MKGKKGLKILFSVMAVSIVSACNTNTESSLSSISITNSSSVVVTLSNIELVTAPTLKTTPGEAIDFEGGKIKLNYSNNTNSEINLERNMITEYNLFEKEITVSYQSKTVKGNITVNGTKVKNETELNTALNSSVNLILVEDGEYEMQVMIKNNQSIIGQSRTGVVFTGPTSDDNFETIDKLTNELYDYAPFVGINDVNASLVNLTIKPDEDKCRRAMYLNGTARATGIAVINSKTYLEKVDILDVTFAENLKGMQNGFGIYAVSVESGKSLTLKNCKIDNFNKCGILARVGVSELVVSDTIVKGFGDTTLIAQNGIQYSCISKITNTAFEGLNYTGTPAVDACGLLRAVVVDLDWDKCVFKDNTFENVARNHGGLPD